MDEFLAAFWIPVALLLFYPLTAGSAKLWPHQQDPRLLKWVHVGGWGLSLLLLLLFSLWRISLRGQWLDTLPFGVAWLAAGVCFLLRWRQMRWPEKLYFGGWFFYPAALAGAYLLDKIFFALFSVPILAFIPNTSYYNGSTCSLREATSGFLSPPRVSLITPVSLFLEKHRGTANANEMPHEEDLPIIQQVVKAEVLPQQHPDTTAITLYTQKSQYTIAFY